MKGEGREHTIHTQTYTARGYAVLLIVRERCAVSEGERETERERERQKETKREGERNEKRVLLTDKPEKAPF